MSHELAFSPESKETLGNDCKQKCVLKSPMHLEGEEGEVRLLAWDKPNSSASYVMSTDRHGGRGVARGSKVWNLKAVCRLSTYARRSKAHVKYQEH